MLQNCFAFIIFYDNRKLIFKNYNLDNKDRSTLLFMLSLNKQSLYFRFFYVWDVRHVRAFFRFSYIYVYARMGEVT